MLQLSSNAVSLHIILECWLACMPPVSMHTFAGMMLIAKGFHWNCMFRCCNLAHMPCQTRTWPSWHQLHIHLDQKHDSLTARSQVNLTAAFCCFQVLIITQKCKYVEHLSQLPNYNHTKLDAWTSVGSLQHVNIGTRNVLSVMITTYWLKIGETHSVQN